MLLEALGFALLAALNPAAVLISAAYLGSARPRKMVLYYLVGAIIVSGVAGVALVLLLHAGGLAHSGERTPRYGLRLGLGLAALIAGIVVARRKPKPKPAGHVPKPGRMARLTSHPAPMAALAVGLILFIPSANFIAAAQVIATAHTDVVHIAIALTLVVLIDVLAVWLPFLFYLAAPEATTRKLKAFDGWLKARRRQLVTGVLLAGGIILIANGSLGLAGVI